MPTYEYHCDACEHHFDEFQSMSEEPLKKCPQCGQNKLRRLFGTGAAVIFKGSGFYETDYRSESYKKAAKAEQEATTTKGADGNNGTSAPSGSAKPAAADNGAKDKAKSSKSQAG